MITLKDENEEFQHILQYELFSRRWIGWVPGGFLQEKVSNLYLWRTVRKYNRYLDVKQFTDENKMPDV